MIIISACLIGMNCRYDGGNCIDETILSLISKSKYMPLCPEQLGGLSTPRLPSYIVTGCGEDVLSGKSKVHNSSGEDVTVQFIRGARATVKIARRLKIDTAIMKEYSPSCGVSHIRRDGVEIEGMGVTSSLLSSEGIRIISSEKLDGANVRNYCNR